MLRFGVLGWLFSLGWLLGCGQSDPQSRPTDGTPEAGLSAPGVQAAQIPSAGAAELGVSVTRLQEAEQLLTLGTSTHKDGVLKIFDWLKQSGLFAQDDQKYFFKVEDLQEIANLGLGLPTQEMFDTIHKELLRRYPAKIAEKYRFIINDAGGALGQVALLYASTKEYLLFFGSPIANGGHSGRYNAEFYDIMLDGEMHTFIEGEVERHVYLPGQTAHLKKGQVKGYRIVDHGWMLEYARGNMIELFPFGVIAPAMFVTLDWESAWKQISDFAALAIKNLFNP